MFRRWCTAAKSLGSRVEIDMESSAYTDRTIDLISELHSRFGGHVRAVNPGLPVPQRAGYSPSFRRADSGPAGAKGYREPASVAFQQKADVDRNYIQLMKLLLEEGEYPGIASHDESVVDECLRFVKQNRIPPGGFEFQMLYGIRRDLQKRLTRDGFHVRSYVPYGDAWYPYFMRRLAERPANVLFIARNFLRG